jgi:hypothetical protein
MRVSLQTMRPPVDDLSRLRELIRSCEKIVVISGAGVSVSTGCELKLISEILLPMLIYLVPTFEDMRKSK